MDGQFLVRQIYDDEITYNIIAAAVKRLKIPANEILELFGRMFFEFCQDSGYDKILQVLGATPRDFLQNLDALHDHLGTLYPGMRAPSFRCTERPEDGALVLHYYSDRPGLEHIVIGITVAKKLHGTDVDMQILKTKEECDHVQFLITDTSSPESKVSPATFCRVFPFHLMFDRDLTIIQTGCTITRVIPRITSGKCKLNDILLTQQPTNFIQLKINYPSENNKRIYKSTMILQLQLFSAILISSLLIQDVTTAQIIKINAGINLQCKEQIRNEILIKQEENLNRVNLLSSKGYNDLTRLRSVSDVYVTNHVEETLRNIHQTKIQIINNTLGAIIVMDQNELLGLINIKLGEINRKLDQINEVLSELYLMLDNNNLTHRNLIILLSIIDSLIQAEVTENTDYSTTDAENFETTTEYSVTSVTENKTKKPIAISNKFGNFKNDTKKYSSISKGDSGNKTVEITTLQPDGPKNIGNHDNKVGGHGSDVKTDDSTKKINKENDKTQNSVDRDVTTKQQTNSNIQGNKVNQTNGQNHETEVSDNGETGSDINNNQRPVLPILSSFRNILRAKFRILTAPVRVRPHLELTFENILSHINTVYVLKTKKGVMQVEASEEFSNLRLKGQMLYIPESDLVIFLCYPSVMNLDDLTRRGLYLSDVPLHDATRDLVLMSEQFEADYKLTRNLELLTDKLQQTYRELDGEKQKTDRLLYSVLPISVANELRHSRPVPAKKYDCVTLLFSGIVGFSAYCAANTDSSGAMKIVNMLNQLYIAFDVLTDPKKNPNVYKVETVGDKYMAVSGLPEPCRTHARCIARLALDMMDLAANDVQIDGEPVKITIGIHSGEVVTGVIGYRMPRYCLFGNTVNLTSRTETTGEPGKINVSEDAYR
ncbi:hypothetical protein PV328_003962 [Microctonus aethiopoides]|uniref:Guanylate cyclase soluble subunit beta-1 n=2 Tax=Braconidae TaxID=7402 RepID=A0AA39F9I5_9HYME|nr:hypothetical protein PV328_003962 [Microctonus aethiopoides]